MRLQIPVRKFANGLLKPFGKEIVNSKDIRDFYLHEYDSYESYRDTQIHHNIRKIKKIWADEETLSLVCTELGKNRREKGDIHGLCHGTRNGFEQNYFSSVKGFNAIGTDISPTATDYPRSFHWDFHDVKEDWISKFDFVYSNSLYQSWNPRSALVTWLNQINDDGFVVVEHTNAHGPQGASDMDPFGARPTVMPYVLLTGLD
jgi:hypothetical protein